MVQQQNWSELYPRHEAKPHNQIHTSPYRQRSAPIHQRIVRHRPLGAPVHRFKKTSQAIGAMKDALIAHQKLHDEAGILHRDISPSHILMGERGGGFLVDWDDDPFEMHGHVDEASKKLNTRVGTIQFLASRQIRKPLKTPKPDLADNHESFYHILNWLALVWGKHQFGTTSTTTRVKKIYERAVCDYIRSSSDAAVYREDDIADRFMQYESLAHMRLASKPLLDLIVDFEAVVASRYDDSELSMVDELQIGEKRYESRKDMLMDPEWIIGRFAKAAREMSIAGDTTRVNRWIRISVLNGVDAMPYYSV